MKTLLVEQESMSSFLSSHAFLSHGYEVDSTEDIEHAWTLLLQNRYYYDLVVLSVDLPNQGALNLLRRLRNQGYKTAAVLLGRRGSGPLDSEFAELGATYKLEQPFDFEELSRAMGDIKQIGYA